LNKGTGKSSSLKEALVPKLLHHCFLSANPTYGTRSWTNSFLHQICSQICHKKKKAVHWAGKHFSFATTLFLVQFWQRVRLFLFVYLFPKFKSQFRIFASLCHIRPIYHRFFLGNRSYYITSLNDSNPVTIVSDYYHNNRLIIFSSIEKWTKLVLMLKLISSIDLNI